jgi:hypothetical protein
MESQQSQPWFEIAQKVHALLAVPGAKERFRDRVGDAAAEWLRRFDAKRQREEARSEAVKRTGVPHGSGRLGADPKGGSFYWLEDFHDGTPPLEAWLPAALSPHLDPDDSPPLPVRAERAVSLNEQYAVLAAVWDARWTADEKINPWGDDEFCREGNCYWFLVHADHLDVCPSGLSDQDAAVVQTWIANVETDLAIGKPPTDAASAEVVGRLLRLVGDQEALMVLHIARDAHMTVNEKLSEIGKIDKRFMGYKSPQLGELLGVADAIIRQTEWWNGPRKKVTGPDDFHSAEKRGRKPRLPGPKAEVRDQDAGQGWWDSQCSRPAGS